MTYGFTVVITSGEKTITANSLQGNCDLVYCGRATACRELVLRAADSNHAKVVDRIAAGDSVTITTGNFHIEVPGRVVFRENYAITEKIGLEGLEEGPRPDTVRFVAGDTLYVFEEDEGLVRWWYRGMLGLGKAFWDRPEAVEVAQQQRALRYKASKPNGTLGRLTVGWLETGPKEIATRGSRCNFEKGEATSLS